MSQEERSFHTVYGRNLVAELKHFVHRPYLVVTMADLWPTFAPHFDRNMAAVHFVSTLEAAPLRAQVEALPACGSVVGLGERFRQPGIPREGARDVGRRDRRAPPFASMDSTARAFPPPKRSTTSHWSSRGQASLTAQ